MFDLDKKRDSFDRDFRRAQKMAVGGFVVVIAMSLGVLVFMGWVIVKLLAYFGVL